jgi:phospholipid/cholesterol/gamma-HCH transport system permease protein
MSATALKAGPPRTQGGQPTSRAAGRARDSSPLLLLHEFAGMILLIAYTMSAAVTPPYPWIGEFIEQSWLMAKRTFVPMLFVTAVFSWGGPGITGGSIIATLGTPDRLGAFAVMASPRELSTWIEGMCVAGIAGTAICSDLGARKIRDELDALAVMGTDVVKTLVVPRFLALGAMTVIFNYWNTLVSIAVQMFTDMTVWHESAAGFAGTFSSNFTLPDVFFNFFKVANIGFLTAVVCCYKGMNVKGGAAGVGRAVNQAVVISFFLVYVFNFVINALLLGAFPQTATLH